MVGTAGRPLRRRKPPAAAPADATTFVVAPAYEYEPQAPPTAPCEPQQQPPLPLPRALRLRLSPTTSRTPWWPR